MTHRTDDHNMFLHQTLETVLSLARAPSKAAECTVLPKISAFMAAAWVRYALKIAKIVEMAERTKAPLIAMWDGGQRLRTA